MRERFLGTFVFFGCWIITPIFCSPEPFLSDTWSLSEAIQFIQPGLSEAQARRYAKSIYRAARAYEIDPLLLIAIARQETSFRQDMPEGRAGERGICQILKSWRNKKLFRREFGQVSLNDLDNPYKSFLYAAWILSDLKKSSKRASVKGSLPYWSYYNARNFESRLKYFVSVNRHLVSLRTRGLAARTRIAKVQNREMVLPNEKRWLADAFSKLLAKEKNVGQKSKNSTGRSYVYRAASEFGVLQLITSPGPRQERLTD